jgi:hypothetical protein
MDEAYLATGAWLLGSYMSILDCSDCLHPAQCGLCTLQKSKTLAVSQQPLQCCMVTLDPVVQILAVDMVLDVT